MSQESRVAIQAPRKVTENKQGRRNAARMRLRTFLAPRLTSGRKEMLLSKHRVLFPSRYVLSDHNKCFDLFTLRVVRGNIEIGEFCSPSPQKPV